MGIPATGVGEVSGQVSGTGEVIGMVGGDELAVTRHSSSVADHSAKSTSHMDGNSQSFAWGESRAKGSSEATSRGTSETSGHSEALRPIFANLPTAVYGLEEQKHIFTDMVISLPSRTAFAVLAGEGMVKIETLDVPDLIVSGKRKTRIKSELKASSGIHKDPQAIEVEIQTRFREFMISAQKRELEPVIEFDPMAPITDEGDIEPP